MRRSPALRRAVPLLLAAALCAAAAPDSSAARAAFLKAREFERAGDDARALPLYRQAFAHDPRSRDLCFLLLDRAKAADSPDSARALAKKCEALPGKPALFEHKLLGEVALRADDSPAALRHYQAAYRLNEEDGNVLYILAGLYEEAGDWEGYTTVVNGLLPRLNYPARLVERQLQVYARLDRSDDGVALLRDAWRATRLAPYGQSLAAYYDARGLQQSLLSVARELAALHPGPEHEWLLARAYAAAHRPDSALQLSTRLLQKGREEKENRDLMYFHASLLFETGRYPEAEAAARRLVKAHPGVAAHEFLLGSALIERRDPGARAALARALALTPLSPDFRARAAYAEYALGAPARAAAPLAYAVSDSLDAGRALLLEAFAHGQLAALLKPRAAWERPAVYSDSAAERSHRLAAVERFEKVAPDHPGHRAARFERATHLDLLGRRAEAQALLRGLVRGDSAHPIALNYLGYLLVEDTVFTPAELAESGALLDRALKLDPENGAYLDSKGWWHYRKGGLDSARVYLENASASMPGDPAILGHLAEVLQAQGRVPEACALFQEARRLDPAHAIPAPCPPAATPPSRKKKR